jgi:hypothetical protein
MADNYDGMTRDEMVEAGLLESGSYRDFAPARDDDPEAYNEMCREDRLHGGWEWRGEAR